MLLLRNERDGSPEDVVGGELVSGYNGYNTCFASAGTTGVGKYHDVIFIGCLWTLSFLILVFTLEQWFHVRDEYCNVCATYWYVPLLLERHPQRQTWTIVGFRKGFFPRPPEDTKKKKKWTVVGFYRSMFDDVRQGVRYILGLKVDRSLSQSSTAPKPCMPSLLSKV